MPQTLLLADDSVTIQRVIELTFADEDINVVAVSDGDQAIARLDAMPPDIVLVDAGMPGKSGYEVAAYVKQTPKLAHIPVVLLTGAFEPVDEARATAAGCDGVLAKPFEPQMVIGRVKELLSRTAPAASHGLMDDIFKVPPPKAAAHAAELWPATTGAQTADEPSAGSKKIDEYFDQLDAAFTNLAGKPSDMASRPGPAMPAELDWFGLQPAGKIDEAPESHAPGQPFWAHEADLLVAPASEPEESSAPEKPHAPEEQSAPHEPAPAQAEPYLSVERAAPPPSQAPKPVMRSEAPPQASPAPAAISLPPLADAFAALLDAEQGEAAAAARPAWPAAARSGQAVSDDLVEQVSRRVIEQLTDRVVREAVAEIAERLVREEIERIKSSIT